MARQRTPEELAKMAANAQKVKAKADAAFTVSIAKGPAFMSGDTEVATMIMYCSRCGVVSAITGGDIRGSKELFEKYKQQHEHILPS